MEGYLTVSPPVRDTEKISQKHWPLWQLINQETVHELETNLLKKQ